VIAVNSADRRRTCVVWGLSFCHSSFRHYDRWAAIPCPTPSTPVSTV